MGPSGMNGKFIGLTIINLVLVAGVFGIVILDPSIQGNPRGKENLFYGYIMTGLTILV